MSFPNTPWVDNGLSRDEKKKIIEEHFSEIMKAIGMDLSDDSLMDTPKRVARMYVDEIFCGLLPENFPKMTVIDNKMKYNDMVTELNITLNSTCEHHFIPIIGKAHVSYIPKNKVVGLSKLNRLVDYYAKRPQVQERLTDQIALKLKELLETDDVAVIIDAVHTCVRTRGIRDTSSHTRTSYLSGAYREPEARSELINSLPKFEL
jgi:GTP cyclohydrolase I